MRPLTLFGGPGSIASLAPTISNYVNQYSMDGATAQTVTWPTGAVACNINAPNMGVVFVSGSGTAVIPAAGITNGTGSACGVAQRSRMEGEQSFSIISSTAQYITIEFWAGYGTSAEQL